MACFLLVTTVRDDTKAHTTAGNKYSFKGYLSCKFRPDPGSGNTLPTDGTLEQQGHARSVLRTCLAHKHWSLTKKSRPRQIQEAASDGIRTIVLIYLRFIQDSNLTVIPETCPGLNEFA